MFILCSSLHVLSDVATISVCFHFSRVRVSPWGARIVLFHFVCIPPLRAQGLASGNWTSKLYVEEGHWEDVSTSRRPAGLGQSEAPHPNLCPWVCSDHLPCSQKLPQGHGLTVDMWCWDLWRISYGLYITCSELVGGWGGPLALQLLRMHVVYMLSPFSIS